MKKTKKFVSHQNDTFSGVSNFKQLSNQSQISEIERTVQKAIDYYTNNQVNEALQLVQSILNNNPYNEDYNKKFKHQVKVMDEWRNENISDLDYRFKEILHA